MFLWRVLFAGTESRGLNWLPYDNCTHIERTSVHLVVDLLRSLPPSWQIWLALLIHQGQPCSFLYMYQPQQPQIHPKLKLVFTFIHLQNLLGNIETSAIENLIR